MRDVSRLKWPSCSVEIDDFFSSLTAEWLFIYFHALRGLCGKGWVHWGPRRVTNCDRWCEGGGAVINKRRAVNSQPPSTPTTRNTIRTTRRCRGRRCTRTSRWWRRSQSPLSPSCSASSASASASKRVSHNFFYYIYCLISGDHTRKFETATKE